MENSRANLAALAVALVAGLLVLHLSESQGLLASLAGIALLIALFAFGQDSSRTGAQSWAFAMTCGLAALGILSFPLKEVVGTSNKVMGQDIIPPAIWLLASALFFFMDRSDTSSSAVAQPMSLSVGYSQPQAMAPAAAAPTPQPSYTPAPVTFAPEPIAPAPVLTPEPPPPAPVTASTMAAPVQPVLTGKQVNIYVNMVGEGMNVLRSVRAEHLGRDFYIIVDEMPADENWEFMPGQVVRCKKKNLSNGKGMVAYEEAPRAQ
jgi:hypothetical protein